MAWSLIVPIVAAVAGSAVTSAGNAKNAKAQRTAEIKNRTDAVNAAEESRQASLSAARSGNFEGQFGFDDIFGVKPRGIDPISVDTGLTRNVNQLRNQGVPAAIEFTNAINQNLSDTSLAFNLERINNLVPTFRDSVNQIGQTSNDLISGRLPQDVAEDVIGNTSGLAASLGTPGGQFPTVLKDLGLTTLDAFNQGQQSLQSLFGSLAADVSPTPNFASAFTGLPFTSLTADQRVMRELQTTQALQNAELIRSQPDPAARQLFLDEFQTGQRNAAILAGTNVPNFGAGAAAQAAGAGITAAGSAFQNQQNQDRADARQAELIASMNRTGTPSTAAAGGGGNAGA